MVAKCKVRGSKPRYALFFFNRDSMAEWIRRLTTDLEIPGSSPGRVVFSENVPKKFRALSERHLEFLI